MITIYTGSVGSGKSYHAVEVGLDWVRRGKYVVANFPLKFRDTRREKRMAERWIYKDEITVDFLIRTSIEKGFYGKESQCLVIFDEAGIVFNSRDWQVEREKRMKWIKFLSQSRKFGYDFIMVAQSDRMIDKQIRGLVEYEVRHHKANNSKFLWWLSIFRVTVFLCVYKWYQTRIRGNLRFVRYKPSVAKRYDTFRTFDMSEIMQYIEAAYQGAVMPAHVARVLDQVRKSAPGPADVAGGSPLGEGTATPPTRTDEVNKIKNACKRIQNMLKWRQKRGGDGNGNQTLFGRVPCGDEY